MNLRFRKLIIIFLALIATYIIGLIVFTMKTGYSIDFESSDEFKFLFKEEYREKLDTIAVKEYRKTDCITFCKMDGNYFRIVEIYDLSDIKLSLINLQKSAQLDNVDFYPAQEIDKKLLTNPTIRSYWNQTWDSVLNVSISSSSIIDTVIRENNYLCIHANFDKILLSNSKNEEMILYNFSGKSPNALILFFKKGNRFFIISANSDNEFGIELLDIFDL